MVDENLDDAPLDEKTRLTAIRAIRKYCIDCSGGSRDEVKKCFIPHCPLYAFRMGKNPNYTKREMTDEQKEQMRERLKRARDVAMERTLREQGTL